MFAAVRDVEADGSRYPVHKCERFSVFGSAERESFVPATEPAAENGAQRGAAQGEFAPGTVIPVTPPTLLFSLI